MQKGIAVIGLVLFLASGGTAASLTAADDIVGKWQVKAETPNGPFDLAFEFRPEAGKISGTATAPQGSGTFSTVKFESPSFSAELQIGDESYRLTATMKDGKLAGAWEQIGGDAKGTWTAERVGQTSSSAPGSGISGVWDSLATTPNGDMSATIELKQDGEKVTGEIRSDMGSLPIQAASFKEGKLQFDIELGGGTYRVQAALKDGKLDGGWAPAEGGDGGSWTANRKAASAATVPAKAAGNAIVGLWNAVASTPDGDMSFQIEIKQAGDSLSGAFLTPDGNLPLPKLTFENDKLSFEVEYMGGNYRIELILANEKLTGKWSAISGSESGAFVAERRKS